VGTAFILGFQKYYCMGFSKRGYVLLAGIIALFIVIFVIAFSMDVSDPLDFVMRLGGLEGYCALSIATIMTPFLSSISRVFGKSFLTIHHIFALSGLALVTLHPIIYAIQQVDISVFIPNFSSWDDFWSLGGRFALILLYIALVAVLLRQKIKQYWRPIHELMYVVLFLAIVHGTLLGGDFQKIGILIIFYLLFVTSVLTFVVKRIQAHSQKRTKGSV